MLLPADKARHVGEAVAMVVARDASRQALDAAEAVEVDYEVLPGVYHSEDAMKPGAPVLWDEAPGNIAVDTSFGDRDATEQRLRGCRSCRGDGFSHRPRHRRDRWSREPHSRIYDAETGRYTLYAGSGGAVRQKRELVDRARHRAGKSAGAVLRRRRQLRHAQSRVRRVRAGPVGRRGSSAGR